MLLSTAYFESHLFVFLYHFYLNVDNILYPVFTLSPFELNNDFILYRSNGICAFLCMCAYVSEYLCVKYPNIAHVQITLYVVYFAFVDFLVHSLYAWGEFDYGMPLQQNHENEKKKKVKESKTTYILSTNALLLQLLVL